MILPTDPNTVVAPYTHGYLSIFYNLLDFLWDLQGNESTECSACHISIDRILL